MDMEKNGGKIHARGQANLETMAIFAAVIIMVLVIAIALPAQASSGEMVRQQSAAKTSVTLLTTTADEVYLAGEGSSRRIWVDMPASFSYADSFIGSHTGSESWSQRKAVSIYLEGVGDVISSGHAPLCGNWPATSGRWQINVVYNDSDPPHVMVNGNC